MCALINAVAHGHLGDRTASAAALATAKENWPQEFESGQEVLVSAQKGLLWFDTRAELEALRAEAEQLLASAQP